MLHDLQAMIVGFDMTFGKTAVQTLLFGSYRGRDIHQNILDDTAVNDQVMWGTGGNETTGDSSENSQLVHFHPLMDLGRSNDGPWKRAEFSFLNRSRWVKKKL